MAETSLRRRITAIVGLALAGVVMVPATASQAAPSATTVVLGTPSEDEAGFLSLLNQARQAEGLAPLAADAALAATARDWSASMASANLLSHDPNLSADVASVEPAWQRLGENVGVGYTVQTLHDAFMASAGHRANIMGLYNRVGIGVVHSGSTIWVTVRFLNGPALPPPPPTVVPGTPTTLHGDFNGDGRGDMFVYGPGSTTDELWFGNANRTMTKVAASVIGQYRPVAGDFDGNGKTDILWYAPGATADYRWSWNGTGWTGTSVTVLGTYTPLTGDFDDDGRDDVLWYGPGAGLDVFWYGNSNGSFTAAQTGVAGTYVPVTGDFDGRNGDDVFWYGPSTGADYVWYATGARGSVTTVNVTVAGSYKPLAGDFDGDGIDDVFWYAPGTTGDATWYMHSTQGSHSTVLRTVNGASYLPAVDDFDVNAADDIIWFSPSGALGDPLWWSTVGATSASPDTVH